MDVLNEALRAEPREMFRVDQDLRRRALANADAPDLWAELREGDQANTARMKEIVGEHGWPGRGLVGEDGANAAWLLVQHADADPAFQERCLALMEAAGADEVRPKDVAYLTDRVRDPVLDGRGGEAWAAPHRGRGGGGRTARVGRPRDAGRVQEYHGADLRAGIRKAEGDGGAGRLQGPAGLT